MTAIELAIFKLNPDADEADFQAAFEETASWLERQPGFRGRRQGRGADGERMECLEWESMAAARAAVERFMSAAETSGRMAAIVPDWASLRHFA